MLDDQQLLRRYAADHSEAAFGELVARHVNLVYSAALRQTNGDAHLAQDVAQMVFADLARKAASLSANVVLAGWLHRATRYAANQIRRTDHRRRAREQEAVMMNAIQSESTPDWEQIRPMLDEALDRLSPDDRDALLLRYFEQRSLAEVGTALGSNEDAARKRVSRALEKLREFFGKRGVTTTAAVLTTVISANAVQIAPAGLAAALTSASLAGAAAGTGAFTLLKLMTMTNLKIGLSTIVVAGAATTLVIQHQAQAKLREENESLRQRVEQLGQLQVDNERLSNLVARAKSSSADGQPNDLLRLRSEVAFLRQQTNEVGKLRTENRQLRSAPASQTASAPSQPLNIDLLKESCAFAGYATPEATLQSMIWAQNTGNAKSFLTCLMPEEAQKLLDKDYKGKSESEIGKDIADDMEGLGGMRITRKVVLSDDEVILNIQMMPDAAAAKQLNTAAGTPIGPEMKWTLRKIGGEWKLDLLH